MSMDITEARIAEVPPSYPESYNGLRRALIRWLERRESNHLTPVDPASVRVRPMTAAEREARNRRLSMQAASGVKRESGFRLVYTAPKSS